MADLTVHAELLIATVARAFYDDEAVCLIDVLLRDKFLRDDDMAPRLQLPAKKLRQTLQFLQDEHLVRSETVDDLAQGGSQATKFYYLDYNRAVHSIRLRVYLLKKQLEQAELRARSSSFYYCPGYNIKRCNGRYTEEEAQQLLDYSTGLFLCQECAIIYENDPNAPSKDTYTLKLMDNTQDLRQAVDNVRRVSVQFSAKMIGNYQLRPGIYDLLQKVRGKGKKPITSNLPSENFAVGIGSKRLAGTGRTAGIKAKKLEQQGIAESAAQAKNYLVGASRQSGEGDLMFLKNAMGHEVEFSVERGGGARAQVLATARRRRRKLMDAAACRVGASLPVHVRVLAAEEERKRKREQEERENAKNQEKKSVTTVGPSGLDFLNDNIGRRDHERSVVEEWQRANDKNVNGDSGGTTSEECSLEEERGETVMVLSDDLEEMRQLSEENRVAGFQTQYKVEMDRQVAVLQLEDEQLQGDSTMMGAAMSPAASDVDDRSVMWLDGDAL